MKQNILLLALFLKLTNISAGGCWPYFGINNPNQVQYTCASMNDTFRIVLNSLDNNLVFDLFHGGSGCNSSPIYNNLQWTKNGSSITGNTQCINAGAGIYQFTCIFNGVNSLTTTIVVTAATATGIQESQEVSGIHIFPNPSASGLFNLKNEISEKAYSINIYNMTGQFISTKEVNQQSDLLDLSDYNKGLYFLEFIFDEGMKRRQKIIYD